MTGAHVHGNLQTSFQMSLDEMGAPLRETTFTVVDLETTGGSSAADAITEIGAVRVCGGEILGEFQTLVDPGRALTPFVSVLTGITDSMLVGAPRIAAVLPAFLEFAHGTVLVAHNAPFDVGFLRAACTAQALPWPEFAVVDTAVLARRLLTRDEVPNCKLATLARHFTAQTEPNHRALSDARATVDVLHALIGRLGSFGVLSLPELRAFTAQVTPAQRSKRRLADTLPHAPGVYVFRDARGTPLYVGTSRDLRTRVRQYFVASETRSRMGEMVGLADRVDPIVCAHPLEAQVRELRLIAEYRPRYNRRSKYPERSVWLTLTDERFPRLSIVRRVRDGSAPRLGPLRSRRQAEALRDAIHDAVPLRRCTDRITRTAVRTACALAGLGRCLAPCETPGDRDARRRYGELVHLVAAAWRGDPRPLVAPLQARLERLSSQRRYEQAAVVRDRITTVVRACARMQRIQSLSRIEELVAARPGTSPGTWELAVVRHGRLAGAASVPAGSDPRAAAAALRATAEAIATPDPVLAEESERILRWLEQDGVRLVHSSQPWSMPARGAGGLVSWLAAADLRHHADPFADRRRLLPMLSRPARATA